MIDLKFNKVSKKYSILQEQEQNGTKNSIIRKIQSLRRPPQDFWALREVDFEVERGEAVGIIGHNGAGKSTILKLLANITTPTSGEITINGRLSALIEVGSGFHPELTGRENIYLNGAILGMSRGEIREKLDSIVDFAGVEQFLDTPVKRFSSGMYVRLGFSIAAHLNPDILLLDEVLAVGDLAFQSKCLERITKLKDSGTTVVFISHDLSSVERLCDRVVLLQKGQIVMTGLPKDVTAEYRRTGMSFLPEPNGINSASNLAAITRVKFLDSEQRELDNFASGDFVTVKLQFVASVDIHDAIFEIYFNSMQFELHCQLTTELGSERINIEAGEGYVEFTVEELGLQPGDYFIDAVIKQREPPREIDIKLRCAMLHVDSGKMMRGGIFYMPHSWQFSQKSNQLNDEQRIDQSLVKAPSR